MKLVNENEIEFCFECSLSKISKWKGWPQRSPVVPYLKQVNEQLCEVCGSKNKLSNKRIYWCNIHQRHSTGLPDYWVLKIDAGAEYERWGQPYSGSMKCPKCKNAATISEFITPNKKSQLKCNCENCDRVLP
jgi:hypothetical protein